MPLFLIPPIKFVPFGEFRTRLVRRVDPDLSAATGDSQSQVESRSRFGVAAQLRTNLRAEAVYQYAHTLFWTPTRNSSVEASDLFTGFVSLKTRLGTVTAGRQELGIGSNRLMEIADYTHRGKSYDGVRFRNEKWDAFAGRVALNGRLDDDSAVQLATYNWGREGLSLFVHHEDPAFRLVSSTLNHRLERKTAKLSAEAEGAYQIGRFAGKELNAYWLFSRLERPVSATTTLFAEGNVASGGGNSTTSHLFDPLYGMGHGPFGLSDAQGLRNVRQLEFGVTQRLASKVTGRLSFNRFALFDPKDGFYNTGNNINRRPGGRLIDSTGQSGTDIGQEFDLGFEWRQNSSERVQLQVGVFQPGHFVRNLVGKSADDEIFLLVGFQHRF